MTKRVVGVLAAIVLALIGTISLAAYVNTAAQRAQAGEELVQVFVVTAPISSGTPAEEISELVSIQEVPLKVRAAGAIESLSTYDGFVAAIDLVPGEQLVGGRFIQRSEFADRAVGIDVPEEMVEVTIELDPERAVGGLLVPGQTVAVLASFDPFEIGGAAATTIDGELVPLPSSGLGEDAGRTPNSTDLLLRKVLVTAVQAQVAGDSEDEQDSRLSTPPEGSVFVTMAVSPFDVERLIFTAENGRIWLAIDRETVPDNNQPGQTRGSVLADVRGQQ